MDRKVIVLTPGEWENKTTLIEAARLSHNHNHYNKDAQLVIKSIVSLALLDLKDGNIQEAIDHINQIPSICDRIYHDSCRAQDGVSGLVTLIDHHAKLGSGQI